MSATYEVALGAFEMLGSDPNPLEAVLAFVPHVVLDSLRPTADRPRCGSLVSAGKRRSLWSAALTRGSVVLLRPPP